MIGTTVGGYQITEKLAEGGMGAVWAARHSVMERAAVVKLLHPEYCRDPEIGQRFLNEARAAASIDDPGIVQVFDVGHLPDGRAYLVMERLGGQTLAARLRERHSAAPDRSRVPEAVNILRLIARTLMAAHANGIVHRDLKPDNIFLVPDPDVAGGERTKIVDFGIAKLATGQGAHATRAGSIFGTPAYMAPEQCADSGSVDGRADLYALGCIAYEMLVGQPPFGGGGLEVIAAQIRDEPVPLRERDPSIPPELEAIVARLLRKDPAERFVSSAELFEALESLSLDPAALRTPLPFDVPPTVPPTKRERPARAEPEARPPAVTTHSAASGSAVTPAAKASKRGVLIAAAGLVAVVGIAIGIRAVGSDAPAPAPPPAAASAPVEQGNPLADAIQAHADQHWAEAISAAERVTRDGDRARAQTLLASARAEIENQRVFETLERAASSGDTAVAARALDELPPTSVYRKRAEEAVRIALEHARVATTPPPPPPTSVVPPAPPKPRPSPRPVKPPAAKPQVRAVEAGPIWDSEDAKKKCPPRCPAPSHWNGGWRTTVPNQMSTCDCETAP